MCMACGTIRVDVLQALPLHNIDVVVSSHKPRKAPCRYIILNIALGRTI
jgi:hypothetical protein